MTEVCGWQPIETAPKDGTHFLAYRPKTDWDGWLELDECVFEGWYDGGQLVSGLYECGEFGIEHATYWMPRPRIPHEGC